MKRSSVSSMMFVAGLAGAALFAGESTSRAATPGGLQASLQVKDDWGTGYCADVVVTNTDTKPWVWTGLTMDIGTSTEFTNWHEVTMSGHTGTITMTNAGAGHVIAPGAVDKTNGFCANRGQGASAPQVLGVAGTVQVPPPPLTGTLRIKQDWGAGYCVDVLVTNNDVVPWVWRDVTVDIGSSVEYTHWYDVHLSGNTGNFTLRNVGAGHVIAPGATDATDGFCVNRGASAPAPAVVGVYGLPQGSIACGAQSCDLSQGNICCENGSTRTCSKDACTGTTVVCNADGAGCTDGKVCWAWSGVSGSGYYCSAKGGSGCGGSACGRQFCIDDTDCLPSLKCRDGSCS